LVLIFNRDRRWLDLSLRNYHPVTLSADTPLLGHATATPPLGVKSSLLTVVGGWVARWEKRGHSRRRCRSLGELQLLSDAPPTESGLVTEGGRTTTGSTQVTGSRPTAAGSVFGYSERTCRMPGIPHLLRADVPPLGAISVTQSGRTATASTYPGCREPLCPWGAIARSIVRLT
jgi:hypothetical protein